MVLLEEKAVQRPDDTLWSQGRLRGLALCGVLGPLQFTLAWIIVGAARPSYSPVRQYISELAAPGGQGALVMVASFLALGLLTLAFVPALHRVLDDGVGGAIGPFLIALFGVGSIGSGIFRCDPGCGGASLSNTLHTLITYTGLGSLVGATLVLPLRLGRARGWAGFRAYSWLTGIVALAIFLRGFAAFGGVGLGQRLFIGALFLWLAALALRLFRLSGPIPTAPL
ncbi:MAG: hypothetical protein AVDCRST_MAG88-4704 [uncultured Thermomicrobiales bacterium]|uniref:DUF998 domain-containing protein n=1 Tax=uncultured Thermomicrobiales bacterium TaxID=1645740 RepID=A0A6J4VZG2_9BACT|nr:MAG: hypothetical protein AVDCRST_MAG88-4704 [uncultured Thermomicrobiales bacterium]